MDASVQARRSAQMGEERKGETHFVPRLPADLGELLL